jgi:uncharacterized membrane protein
MNLLIAGVLLWAAVHLFPGFAPTLRASLSEKLGNPYRGIISLLLLGSVTLLVLGWQATEPEMIYSPPEWGPKVAPLFIVTAFFFMASSYGMNSVKYYLRHPQLTGFMLWAVGHLISNGDNRSVILFGGLLVWALLEMLIISRRDGKWDRPSLSPFGSNLKNLGISVVLYIILVMAHPYMTGVPAIQY